MKIVVNKCFGGFELSAIAIKNYLAKVGKECYFYKTDYNSILKDQYILVDVDKASNYDTVLTKNLGDRPVLSWEQMKEHWFYYNDLERNDPNLIAVVEELGCEKSSGELSELSIIEIPDDVDYYIDNYDGIESVHEKHRSW